jgi:hypothetical protein
MRIWKTLKKLLAKSGNGSNLKTFPLGLPLAKPQAKRRRPRNEKLRFEMNF